MVAKFKSMVLRMRESTNKIQSIFDSINDKNVNSLAIIGHFNCEWFTLIC